MDENLRKMWGTYLWCDCCLLYFILRLWLETERLRVIGMYQPKILLSGNTKLQYYVDAVAGTGGIAVAKYLPEVDTDYDGLILCGGNDIDPGYYGQEMDGAVNIDYARDAAEFALLKAFIALKKPVMGICRGCQLINIFFGGTLDQDIKNAAEHSSFSDFDLIHRVHAVRGSIAENLYGADFVVNSFHHQAIKCLGNQLKATMRSADHTVIEGFEHESLPVLGLQWHSERMCFTKRRADTVDGALVFDHFVRMCEKQSGHKHI